MKKLITLSAILAAGTLCANAATVLSWTDFNNKTSGDYTLATTSDATINANTGALSVTGTSPASATIDISKAGLTLAKGFTISLELKVDNWGSGTYGSIFAFDGATTTSLGGLMAYTSNQNPISCYKGSVSKQNYANVSTLSSLSTSTSAQRLTVSFVKGTWQAYLGETLVLKGTYTDNTQSYSDEVIQNIYFGSCSTSNPASSTNLLNETISSIAVFNTTMTGAEVIAAIPEPSFFGLFAGTLALGFAGTRRRRHAK